MRREHSGATRSQESESSGSADGKQQTRRRLLLLGLSVGLLVWFGLLLRSSGALPFAESYRTLYNRLTVYRGPVRVGLQVGHLKSLEHPEELAKLRYNTGAHAGGLNEVDVNANVARHLSDSLSLEGIEVDILPATLPPNYKADLLLALHADASPDPRRRGYKSSHAREPRNAREPELKRYIDEAYFYFSGLPDDDANVSGSMLEYYAFNYRKYRHSAAPSTPALLVEMGYLSHPDDRAFLVNPVNPAYALKQGIIRYLAAQNRVPKANIP